MRFEIGDIEIRRLLKISRGECTQLECHTCELLRSSAKYCNEYEKALRVTKMLKEDITVADLAKRKLKGLLGER